MNMSHILFKPTVPHKLRGNMIISIILLQIYYYTNKLSNLISRRKKYFKFLFRGGTKLIAQ